MPIDVAEVRRIAALAKLDLDPATEERFRQQLQAIVDYVAQLDQIDLDDVPPFAPGSRPGGPRRDDCVVPSLSSRDALANAPDAAEGHFRVPRVLDG